MPGKGFRSSRFFKTRLMHPFRVGRKADFLTARLTKWFVFHASDAEWPQPETTEFRAGHTAANVGCRV